MWRDSSARWGMRCGGSPSIFFTLRHAGRRCRSSAAKPCGPSSWSTPPPRPLPGWRPRSSPRGWGAVRVQLRVDPLTEQRPTWNVIGRRAGRSARTVVIGAHLDSVEVSPGANDNGSGIAAALEAARPLATLPLEFSVEIVGFGAEERGLLGSAHYVRERGNQVAGMVNMDMVGVGTLQVGNGSGSGPLIDAAERIAARLGLRLPRFRLPGASAHASLERAGIPTVFIHTGDDPLIHTPNDVLERVDARLMAQAAQLAAADALEGPGGLGRAHGRTPRHGAGG